MRKIVDSFLGIARVIYDLEAEMTAVIDALSNCKSSAAPEAIERVSKAQKTLMSSPKRKASKPEIIARNEEAEDAKEIYDEGESKKQEFPKPWENESA